MDMLSAFRSVRSTAYNHGTWPACYDISLRLLNKCVYYRQLRCFVVDSVNPTSMQLPQNLRFTRLEEEALLDFAGDPANELDARFVRRMVWKGDECYGILDGDRLANYGWYSRKPTLIDTDDLFLHFDPDFVYMYKGFTLPQYRGLRLHAISKTRALAEFLSRGLKGMVSYVESNNFNSIKSTCRMGARDCGQIHLFRVMGRYIVRKQSCCHKYGLHLSRNATSIASL